MQRYEVSMIQVSLKNVCMEQPWRIQLVSIFTTKGSIFIVQFNQDTNSPEIQSSCTANYKRWDSLGSGFLPGTQLPEFAGKPLCKLELRVGK